MTRSSENAIRARSPRAGFTLAELLAVVGIVAALAGLVARGVVIARRAADAAKCASNLRSMAAAAIAYADDHHGEFPWGLKRVDGYKSWAWDFVIPNDGEPRPGAMWQGYGVPGILQCPSCRGLSANWQGDPYTGYNYNCSFVGKVEGDSASRSTPARIASVKAPAKCALFGDGEFSGGANKFMRAPRYNKVSDRSGKSLRIAGTQGFRHRGKTNVAFCDGHVEALVQPYDASGKKGETAPRCGFISPDNSLYDLE